MEYRLKLIIGKLNLFKLTHWNPARFKATVSRAPTNISWDFWSWHEIPVIAS